MSTGINTPADSTSGCPQLALAAAQLLAWLRDPETADASLTGYQDLDLKPVWDAMREDHAESLEICGQEDWPATLIAGLEALLEVAGPAGPRRARHRKRGTTYSIVGTGSLQAAVPVVEGERLVAYTCDIDGRFWFRPEAEFRDGRFEILD